MASTAASSAAGSTGALAERGIEVQALQHGHLPDVAALLQANIEGFRSDPAFLARTLIDGPWCDEEIPSLVALDWSGEVVGFVGAQVRRMRHGKRPIRAVCASHLTVLPESRGAGAATAMVDRLMTGPQAVTWSDAAIDQVLAMCRARGGQFDHSRAFDWMIVLRPMRWLGSIGTAALRRNGEPKIPVGAFPFQAVAPRSARRAVPDQDAGIGGEDVDAASLVPHLEEIMAGYVAYVDYDVSYLDHLFAEIDAAFGAFCKRLVRRDGRPIGWYAYVTLSDGVRRVLHIAAREEETEAVMGELLAHSAETGCVVLTGRAGPPTGPILRNRFPILGFARQPIIHVRDPELRAVMSTSSSLLSQMDGEWYIA